MQKNTVNVAFTAGGAFSFFGGIWPFILKLFGYAETAMSVDQLVTILPTLNINWRPLYIFAFILCVTGLLFHNWNFLVQLYKKHKHKKEKNWDMRVADALIYIGTHSKLANAMSEDADVRDDMVYQCLEEAAQQGKLKILGKKVGRTYLEEIKSAEFKDAKLRVRNTRADKSAALIKRESDGKWSITYEGLLVNKRDVFSLWPKLEIPRYGNANY